MLHYYINANFYDYLKSKRERLESEKWWIFDQCQSFIREHAKTVLFSGNGK
jgi:hypothetical protein